jgi:hypothetical protein
VAYAFSIIIKVVLGGKKDASGIFETVSEQQVTGSLSVADFRLEHELG